VSRLGPLVDLGQLFEAGVKVVFFFHRRKKYIALGWWEPTQLFPDEGELMMVVVRACGPDKHRRDYAAVPPQVFQSRRTPRIPGLSSRIAV
jgi:hypothetical protein